MILLKKLLKLSRGKICPIISSQSFIIKPAPGKKCGMEAGVFLRGYEMHEVISEAFIMKEVYGSNHCPVVIRIILQYSISY